MTLHRKYHSRIMDERIILTMRFVEEHLQETVTAAAEAILLHGGNDSYFEELFMPMLYLADKEDACNHCSGGNVRLTFDTFMNWILQMKESI